MTEFVFQKSLYLKPTIDTPYHFVVVGAGGTGGYLVPHLVRQIGLLNERIPGSRRPGRRNNKHSITLVDGDVVEQKNLVRQNFTQRDLGKNKAEVLANRYGKAFNVSVGAIPEFIESPSHFAQLIQQSVQATRPGEDNIYSEEIGENNFSRGFASNRHLSIVLIDCTDNNKTRLIIETVGKQLRSESKLHYLISSGNEEKNGQVVFSALNSNAQNPLSREFKRLNDSSSYNRLLEFTSTPTFFDIFPNSPLDKLPTELSCAEAAESAPQNIGANMNAANIIFDFCNKLLNCQRINEFLVFFDIQAMNHTPFRFTESDLTKVLNFVPNNQSLKHHLNIEVENPVSAPYYNEKGHLVLNLERVLVTPDGETPSEEAEETKDLDLRGMFDDLFA